MTEKSDTGAIGIEVLDDGIGIVVLQKPPANTMDPEFLEQFCDHMDALAADSNVRAVVITAAGKAFCAGVDLKEVIGYDRDRQRAMVNGINRMVRTVYGFRAPVVAGVNGHAIAGGVILALCCDHRVGPEAAGLYGLAEARAAVPFPFAAIEVARAELPPSAARKVILFAGNMAPDEALDLGIFDELRPLVEVRERAIEQARTMAALPPDAFNTIKRQLRGPALERIAKVIDDQSDPALDNWITDETRAAAEAILGGRD